MPFCPFNKRTGLFIKGPKNLMLLVLLKASSFLARFFQKSAFLQKGRSAHREPNEVRTKS